MPEVRVRLRTSLDERKEARELEESRGSPAGDVNSETRNPRGRLLGRGPTHQIPACYSQHHESLTAF